MSRYDEREVCDADCMMANNCHGFAECGFCRERFCVLDLDNGGWCPTCKGDVYFIAKWRGITGNYLSECKQCGERRLYEDTDLIGAIHSLMANGGAVTRKAWTMGPPPPLRVALWGWRN